MRKLTEKDKIDIVTKYKSGKNTVEIARDYNITASGTWRVLKKENIKMRTFSECQQKYKIDETFFDCMDSPIKSQILGFIYADGYNTGRGLGITISKKDENYLRKIKKELKSSHPIKFINNKYVSLVISNKKIKDGLEKCKCPQKKSLTLIFPDFLKKNLLKYFILGYFEGDGSIFITNSKRQQPGFSICGTHDVCNKISEIITKETDIKPNIQPIGSIYNLYIRGRNQIVKVMEWLYSNPTNLIMKRKYKIYKRIKKKLHIKSSIHKNISYDKDTKMWRYYQSKNNVRFISERFNSEIEAVKGFNSFIKS